MAKIYVGNLPFNVNEVKTVEHAGKHGRVERVSLVIQKAADEPPVAQAMGGRELRVNEAIDRPRRSTTAVARRVRSGADIEQEPRVLPTLNDGLSIQVRGGLSGPRKTVRRELGGTLLLESARALRHPGIARRSVFTATGVKSYSAYASDPSKIVRESTDGTKTVGRLVGGRFRPTSGR